MPDAIRANGDGVLGLLDDGLAAAQAGGWRSRACVSSSPQLAPTALRLSLWRANDSSGLWKDLECCSIPDVDGPAARSG